MSVCTDHGAVKSYINCVLCGNEAKLCGDEVLLADAVLLVEKSNGLFLDRLVLCSLCGSLRDQNVESLTGERLRKLLLILLLCEVGKKIGNAEYGIAGLVAELDVYACSVGTDDNAVERKRYGSPLILAETAVVVGLEVCASAVLKERMLLEVEAGEPRLCAHPRICFRFLR